MPKMIYDESGTPWSVEYVGPAAADLDELVFLRIHLTKRVSATVPRGQWPRFTQEELRAIFERARTTQGVEDVEPAWDADGYLRSGTPYPDKLYCVGGPHDGEIRAREDLPPLLNLSARQVKHYVRAPRGGSDVWLWQDEPLPEPDRSSD